MEKEKDKILWYVCINCRDFFQLTNCDEAILFCSKCGSIQIELVKDYKNNGIEEK